MTIAAPALSIQGLRVEYTGDRGVLAAVEDVSIEIEAGEVHAVVGESGAGKSTVGNAVLGLVDPPGRVAAGKILVSGRRLGDSVSGQAIVPGRDIGAIFQDPMTSLNPLFTVGSQLVETMTCHLRIGAREARSRAVEILRIVEMPEPERRYSFYPHQLSGGQRQRVVIGAALCCNPALLVADEPTTALDVSVQAQILKLIRQLADERRLGVLLITHNIAAVAQIADRVTIMRAGRIVESGSVQTVLTRPQHSYARDLIQSVPRLETTSARLTVRRAAAGETGGSARRSHGCARALEDGDTLLDVQNITVEYPTSGLLSGHRSSVAVDDVSLAVKRGEIFGIVGESGSGKTTLANVIAGLIRPTKGDVLFEGRSIASIDNPQSKRAIQMVFQDPYSSLNPRMRVGRAIAEPAAFYRLAGSHEEAMQQASLLLKTVDLNGDDVLQRFPYAFSGGQRQRISIARALAARPALLICDEPTSSLDVSVQARILKLLKDLRDSTQLTMLFISHDLAVVRQMCDRVAVMKAGQIVEMSMTDTLFGSPQHPYTRHLLSCIPSMNPVRGGNGGHQQLAATV